MKGIFYGVGIGPGDSSLMTLKAVRLIEKSGNIVFPGEVPEETLAYRIVTGEIDLSGKELMGLSFPMSNDKEYVASCHRANADNVCAVLDEGSDVVLPVLGDPGVYSTFSYVADLVRERGYGTRIIPGITSFCAAAAEDGTNLIYGDEALHVLPNAGNTEEDLKLPGTKVFMKTTKNAWKVMEKAESMGLEVAAFENCTMDDSRVYHSSDEAKDAGYYTLVVVKDR